MTLPVEFHFERLKLMCIILELRPYSEILKDLVVYFKMKRTLKNLYRTIHSKLTKSVLVSTLFKQGISNEHVAYL